VRSFDSLIIDERAQHEHSTARRPAVRLGAATVPTSRSRWRISLRCYLPLNDVPLGEPVGAQAVANGNLAVSWLEPTFEGMVDAADELESFNGDVGRTAR
jgi:hypothetical protein